MDVDIEEIGDLFIELLREANFVVLEDHRSEEEIQIIGLNRKRSGGLGPMLMSWFGGYVERNRIGIELQAKERPSHVRVELKCVPYLSQYDMELIPEENEVEKCMRILSFFGDKLLERVKSG